MIIGIDPGKTGAYCLLSDRGVEKLENFPILDGMIDFWGVSGVTSVYNSLCLSNDSQKIQVVIERPFILSSQRGNDIIWRNYERLWLAFEPDLEVRPQEWKKRLGIPRGLSKKESIQYQYENFCKNKKMANSEVIDWHKILPSGRKSKNLDEGKIDAYCIALANLKN